MFHSFEIIQEFVNFGLRYLLGVHGSVLVVGALLLENPHVGLHERFVGILNSWVDILSIDLLSPLRVHAFLFGLSSDPVGTVLHKLEYLVVFSLILMKDYECFG